LSILFKQVQILFVLYLMFTQSRIQGYTLQKMYSVKILFNFNEDIGKVSTFEKKHRREGGL